MRICVTGGSGFIGRHLLGALAQQWPKAELVNLDIKAPELAGPGTWIEGSILDSRAARKACAGASHVINLAAAHSDFGISTGDYFEVNQRGTQTLLQAAGACGVRRVLHYSSVAVYGTATPNAAETAPLLPENDYGRSKKASEEVVAQWVDATPGASAVVIRPAVVVGPWHRANLYRLIDQIAHGRFPCFFGKGEQIKSLVNVQNLAEFTVALLEPQEADARLETFNCVDYPQLTVRRTIEVIHEELGKRPSPVTIPLSLGLLAAKPFDLAIKLTGRNLPISSARVRKLATSTQFDAGRAQARHPANRTAEDGVRSTVRWYLAQQNR